MKHVKPLIMGGVKDPRKQLGENIRRLRTKLGISQEELADLAELHRTYIGQVERGETNISLLNIVRLAKALGSSVAQLVAGM